MAGIDAKARTDESGGGVLEKSNIYKMSRISKIVSIAGLTWCLGLSSCVQTEDKYDEFLNVEQPFGQSWDVRLTPDQFKKESCDTTSLEKIFTPSELETIEANCLSKQSSWLALSEIQAFSLFPTDDIGTKNNEFSVIIKGSGEPFLYTYSYLHELLPTEETRKKKRQRAKILKKALKRKYGPANMQGYFDMPSKDNPTGFIVSKTKKPCSFWVVNDFGVLLCSERIVFIDGYELGLDFFNLKRHPYGRALRDLTLEHTIKEVHDHDENTIYQEIKILTDWMNSQGICDTDNLETLDDKWSLSSEQIVALNPILKQYSGAALSDYIFTGLENDDELLDDKTTMYLFKKAAEQGSAAAMNEIGASLLYCYQGVERDESRARFWIDKAFKGGDSYAAKTQALLKIRDMNDELNPKEFTKDILEECASFGEQSCREELTAFQTLYELVK